MHKFSPTEDLILDLLGARYRLGDKLWTFDSRLSGQLLALEKRGLLTRMHGVTPNTFRASLTEAGKKEAMSDEYTAPLEDEVRSLRKSYRKLGEESERLSAVIARMSLDSEIV